VAADGFSWTAVSKAVVASFRHADTRNVAAFAAALLVFATAQAAYAVSSDSLGLLSDATHTFFHALAIGVSAVGMVIARQPPNKSYPYGHERFEVLSAFSNALFLAFVVMFVGAGALQRILQPGVFDADASTTLLFGIVSLTLNAGGIVALGPALSITAQLARFQRLAGGPGAQPLASGMSKVGLPTAATSVYLHAATDAASAVAVILSSLLQRFVGIGAQLDALQALAVCGFTLHLVFPLFQATGA